MNDENKPNGTSEGRVSKLKRRRRTPNNNNHNVNAEGGSRQKLGTITAIDDDRPNGASANHQVAKARAFYESKHADPLRVGLDGLRQIRTNKVPVEDSDLGFVAQMDESELQSALSWVSGIKHYTKSEYEQAVGQSFAYNTTRQKTEVNQKAFDHSLLGQIDLSANTPIARASRKDGKLSLAFPLPKTEKVHKNDECHSVLFGAFNRPTENGIRIPLSFCQFPHSKSVEVEIKQSETKVIQSKSTDENKSAINSVALTNEYEYIPQNGQTDNNESNCIERARRESMNKNTEYKSKIRIEATIGASIREVFDIDVSERVIGKLQYGDERYFLEKKMLPPPPFSEEDYDDECVAVMRYKIVLEEGDDISGVAERDDRNRKVGWISDRGRLADEPYIIVREV